jgi:hypothetical protein
MTVDFWKKSSPRRKRIISIAVVFVVLIVVSSAGALTPLSAADADAMNKDYNQTMVTMDNLSFVNRVTYIFGNNLMICLLGFTPIVGVLWEFLELYVTGVEIGAVSLAQYKINPLLAFFSVFLTPVGWLEFAAYSTAIAESLWLTRRIMQHRGKGELVNACILISISAVVLLVSAFIEVGIESLLLS